MVQVQQRFLKSGALLLSLAIAAQLQARRFYDDDPIWREPNPVRVEKVQARKLSDYYDFFLNTFFEPGEKQARKRSPADRPPIPAQAVNTLGEVPDSGWYQNRHGKTPMSREELVRGSGNDHAPSMSAPWKVISAKSEGVTPGFTIVDSQGRRFLVKVDPPTNPEMATAADVIGCKFFHAFGYYVPENYIVRFDRQQLAVASKAKFRDATGKQRELTERDLSEVLRTVPRDREGRFRGMASLYLNGELIGPFRYNDVRRDDPNDVVPHEHRRDLRGLYVFAAWLNHTDTKSLNSLDAMIEEGGLRYVRHNLIDFGAILGSDSLTAKSPRAGNVFLFDFKPAAVQFLSLGLYVPAWARAHYPHIPEVGNFESKVFDPEHWKNNYPNPAFDNRLPDDSFWAAKQVMTFTDEQIRAMVETGEYSNLAAVEWITNALIARRDKIGRAFFKDVLPLDGFRVANGKLEFDDLAVKYNFIGPRQYAIQWSRFDNEKESKTSLAGETTFNIPKDGTYLAADITAEKPNQMVTVYLRNKGGRIEVVGIERRW